MPEFKITNLVKLYSICLLKDKPKYGYELIKEIGEKLDKRISPGQIYPFLKKLERNKLVISKRAGSRDKKSYRLTKKGKEFVEGMLSRFGDLVEIAIEPKLTVCAHCGCEIYKGGYRTTIKGKKMAFCCIHCANSFKKGSC